ncbi:prohead core protein [Klebsiella phage CPRSA]|nr:prohead core protein [Klebsiella phage CPRSA]
MKEFIEAIKSGNLVEAKKTFYSIMEDRKEALRHELRVELAEAVRIEKAKKTKKKTTKALIKMTKMAIKSQPRMINPIKMMSEVCNAT